jgi:uncharacterized C2H2 Zn-finger protein
MTASRFDRLRPRTEPSDPAPSLDNEGKRALFSSTDVSRQGGAIVIDCSRCSQVTTLTPAAAMRAMFPALHLSVVVGRGDRQTSIGVLRRRRYGSWLRCPACGQVSWARVTVRV